MSDHGHHHCASLYTSRSRFHSSYLPKAPLFLTRKRALLYCEVLNYKIMFALPVILPLLALGSRTLNLTTTLLPPASPPPSRYCHRETPSRSSHHRSRRCTVVSLRHGPHPTPTRSASKLRTAMPHPFTPPPLATLHPSNNRIDAGLSRQPLSHDGHFARPPPPFTEGGCAAHPGQHCRLLWRCLGRMIVAPGTTDERQVRGGTNDG